MPAPLTIHSRDNLLRWPRVPVPNEAPVLILMNQFQRTQNLSAETVRTTDGFTIPLPENRALLSSTPRHGHARYWHRH